MEYKLQIQFAGLEPHAYLCCTLPSLIMGGRRGMNAKRGAIDILTQNAEHGKALISFAKTRVYARAPQSHNMKSALTVTFSECCWAQYRSEKEFGKSRRSGAEPVIASAPKSMYAHSTTASVRQYNSVKGDRSLVYDDLFETDRGM